jgi:cell division protein FtsW (lipid II flippase)
VVGEDLGALGWTLVAVAFGYLVVRCVHIGSRAEDLFGLLVCCGVGSLICAQAVVNLGVVAGIVPNTGLVLPFVSYGASAALVDTLALGLVLKIALETREMPA